MFCQHGFGRNDAICFRSFLDIINTDLFASKPRNQIHMHHRQLSLCFDSFHNLCGLNDADTDRAVAAFREYFPDKGLFENEVYPGIPALLAHLKSEGKRLFVATSKLDTMAERILEHFGLAPYFDAICGAPEGDKEAGKKVNVVKAALKAAGCDDLSRAVMVGDREHDVIGAHLAGLDVIGVLYGYGSREELTAAGADQIAETPEALETLILSTN